MKDFGMFTPAGDGAVAALVATAIENYRGPAGALALLGMSAAETATVEARRAIAVTIVFCITLLLWFVNQSR